MLHHRLVTVVGILARLVAAGQPSAPRPYDAPLRDLDFGQINFLHTTDTHGWHAGHLLEPSYGADWGDYIDFAARLREKLEADGKDLLVIDTGDRIEGNGLYDGSKPRGKYTFDIFRKQHIDLICSGNHELYKASSARDEQSITVPAYSDAYLASNLDIFDTERNDFVPLGAKYKKFETKKQGIRIMSFGFLYDFERNSNNTRVQPVEDAIKESWFQDAIRDPDIDLFVVIGHSAVRSQEFDAVFKAIRTVKWDVPIQFFGGHFHIRDYRKYDSKAYGLASGRFMETIGFQSISGLPLTGKDINTHASPTFFRRYIDNNLYSMYHHSGLNVSTFHSKHGKKVSKLITSSRSALKLDHIYGCAPENFWMSRAPYPSNSSIFSYLETRILPAAANDTARGHKSRLILLNTGAIRFDIFKGAFTKDSTYIVSPFTSTFRYLPDISYSKAKQLIKILNSAGQIFTQATNNRLNPADLAPPEQHGRTDDYFAPTSGATPAVHPHQQPLLSLTTTPELRPGYTTIDDAGTEGDDTIHSPISFYRVPNVIQSVVNNTASPISDDSTVDVVFNEFIQPYLLLALRFLGEVYADDDTKGYMEGKSFTNLLAKWIGDNWEKDC